jgi:hypothetical protein
VEAVAAAHSAPVADPCAKNFKLPYKIVAVVDSTLPQEEVNDACKMVEQVASMGAEAPPRFMENKVNHVEGNLRREASLRR